MNRTRSNIYFLQQGSALLHSLSDEQYSMALEDCYGSSCGAHIRHNLDHYHSFMQGCQTGHINYDSRERNPLIETSTQYAQEAIRHVIAFLENFPASDLDKPCTVSMDDGQTNPSPTSQSSLGRELQFLISHTIHHYALIAINCHRHGITLPENFGIAPSTARYQQETCAR